jgi:hypothetical protein
VRRPDLERLESLGGAGVVVRARPARHLAVGDVAGDLHYRAGDRDAAFADFDPAQNLLADVAPSPTKAHVLSSVARFQLIELRADEAIRVETEALAMAEQLGLDEVRAHVLRAAPARGGFDAAEAVAAGEYARAADVYGTIGSRPDGALARSRWRRQAKAGVRRRTRPRVLP